MRRPRLRKPKSLGSPPRRQRRRVRESETPARFDAAYLRNPAPRYPPLARRLGEQGRIILRVRVDSAGNPATIELFESSGSARLDAAARQTVAGWRFVPARRGGKPIKAGFRCPSSSNWRIEMPHDAPILASAACGLRATQSQPRCGGVAAAHVAGQLVSHRAQESAPAGPANRAAAVDAFWLAPRLADGLNVPPRVRPAPRSTNWHITPTSRSRTSTIAGRRHWALRSNAASSSHARCVNRSRAAPQDSSGAHDPRFDRLDRALRRAFRHRMGHLSRAGGHLGFGRSDAGRSLARSAKPDHDRRGPVRGNPCRARL